MTKVYCISYLVTTPSSTIKRGQEFKTPIHMVISQKDTKLDIVGNIRKAENNAAKMLPRATHNILSVIEEIRRDKAYDNEIKLAPLIQKLDLIHTSEIDKLTHQSLDTNIPSILRQTALNRALSTDTVKIPPQDYKPEIMSSEIYRCTTTDTPNKESLRINYAAHNIVKYATSSNAGPAHTNDSKHIVSSIFNAALDDGHTKDLLMKNSAMILRQATESKHLSFKDRVNKVVDKISMVISPEKKAVKSFVETLKAERQAAKSQEITRH